jgi:hypothetical protein
MIGRQRWQLGNANGKWHWLGWILQRQFAASYAFRWLNMTNDAR